MQPLSDSQRKMLEEATQTYHEALFDSGGFEAAKWLMDRGLGDTDVAIARLGVVTDPFPGHGPYKGYVSIPYLDRNGQPLMIRFRCIQQHDHRVYGHGKYMTMAGDFPRVYNIGAIHRAADVIEVAEGEIDALILQKLGLYAVAIPGVHIWRGHMRRMLAGFSKVRVWADPDDAGADLANRITRSLRTASVVRLKNYDVNDTYLREGAEGLLSLIREES